MQKKSRRPREKVLSMALMLVMLVLGILCFLTPLSTLVGVQYLAFGCLAIYGAVMVVRYIGSEHKSKFLPAVLCWQCCRYLWELTIS